MAGTKAGGQKAAKTNLKLHGEDFYSRIGQKGGQNGHTGGFAANPELARRAGAKGGKISKRGPSKNKTTKKVEPKKAETQKEAPKKRGFLFFGKGKKNAK